MTKMFYPIYLTILVCLSSSSAESTESDCVKLGHVYQTLDSAEQMIKSAKEKVSTRHLTDNTLERDQVHLQENTPETAQVNLQANNLKKTQYQLKVSRKDLCECQDVPLLKTDDNKKEDLEFGFPQDCEELFNTGQNESGVYKVRPVSSIFSGPIAVYCDMETDGGGWTVIQRRADLGFENNHFYRDWRAYTEGFGNLERAFWLGNNKIYAISNQGHYSIRFDLEDFHGNKAHAVYETFFTDDENNSYKLYVGNYSGNAGDSFSQHNGMKFSTRDVSNSEDSDDCAELRKGAWWFKGCGFSSLNGEYHRGQPPVPYQGVFWYHWESSNEKTLRTTEMKIRKSLSGKK